MKRTRLLSVILIILIFFPAIPASAASPGISVGSVSGISPFPALGIHDMPAVSFLDDPNSNETYDSLRAEHGEMRGVWVSTVLNLDYPSSPGISVQKMKSEAIAILDECVKMGFNSVIFQVRPCGDAFYKSDIFPWSEYLTGSQGTAPSDGFDPLKFWVEEAHKRGLELHAWINPYRIARNNHDIDTLAKSNPARQNPGWVIKHTDGHMYYDPGIPEVQKLVVDGVKEIVKNYDVDGIHLDDYFYPDNGIDDAATYKTYGSAFKSRDDWRRDNVDTVVKNIASEVKLAGKDIEFGISPFGIWANKSSNSLGSDTKGNQSYYSHFADTRKWVKSGWIDYICPQLYWNIGYNIADYEKLVYWWTDVVSGTSVDLYIGHASYRCGNSDSSSPWYGTEELRRQLDMNAGLDAVKGSVHFRYAFFKSYPALGTFITNYYNKTVQSPSGGLAADYPRMPEFKQSGIYVGRPSSDITTSYSEYYMLGSCETGYPLYMNGEAVTVTADGYFGVMVSLKSGKNSFSFTQNGKTVTRTITRSAGSSGSSQQALSKAEIVDGSTYPSVYDVYIMPGEKITFRCTAPIGATVTVTLAGKTYNLTPATTSKPSGSGIYGTQFSYVYTMGTDYAPGKVYTVGTPVYKMTYNGSTSTVTATGDLKCITDGAPYYATVKESTAFIYASSSTSGGPIGELSRGMTDYITAVTTSGTWVRLASGYWIQRVDVDRVHGTDPLRTSISTPSYSIGSDVDKVSFPMSSVTATHVTYSSGVVTVKISNASSAPSVTLPSGSVIASTSATLNGSTATYTFVVSGSQQLDGYWVEVSGGNIVLNLKRRPQAGYGDKPLTGITIMLDAGHGGSGDTGAVGPMGGVMPEKDIALHITKKVKYELESLGAKIIMTRESDVTVTLVERLQMNRQQKPDLFLSIHLNAVNENKDATSIYGISTWYMQGISADFSSYFASHLASDLGRYNRKANYSNLYVCRGAWCPSLILETGFICCPSEYEWLADDAGQSELAGSIARGILQYFR